MKKIVSVLLLLSLLASMAISFSSVRAQSGNSWAIKAPMPSARAGFGLATVNGKIYAMGGWNKNQTNFVTVNEEYDPATNTWAEKAPMLTARVSFAVAVYENKIYTFGGQVLDAAGKRIVINITEVYDPATDTWARKASLPKPAEDFGASVVEGKIYVIGTQTDVYDPTIDSWITKTPIPHAIAHSAYAVLDDKIYVIAGNFHGNNASFYQAINLNQIYDPKTDQWSSGAHIPNAVATAAAAATSGANAPKAIYVVGGLVVSVNASGSYVYNRQNLVQVYFPENNSWSLGASMPTARYSLSAVGVDDTVYAIGGSYSLNPPDAADNEQYLPIGYGTMTSQSVPQTTIYIIAIVVIVAALAVAVAFTLRKRQKA